jgi:hypothetical protein
MMRRGTTLTSALVLFGLVAYGCATSVNPGGEPPAGAGGGGGGEGGAGGQTSSSAGTTSSGPQTSSSTASSTSTASGGPICGDGLCDPGETCQACPADCGSCCGDSVCAGGETCQTCPADCGVCCGDGVCAGGETCQTCPTDCDCCGNGICDANECTFCPFDCGDCCGNGVCDFLEDCQICATDCGPGCCPTPSPGDPTGPSIFLFTNYDGGPITVSVDADVPNIVLGFVSYEGMTVTITGPYAGNVVAVHYAGYNDLPGTTVAGVAPGIVSILQLPPVTLSDPSGWPNMVCNAGGGCGDQGGCNTAAQAKDYFVSKFAGQIVSHACQYGVFAGALSTSAVSVCN